MAIAGPNTGHQIGDAILAMPMVVRRRTQVFVIDFKALP